MNRNYTHINTLNPSITKFATLIWMTPSSGAISCRSTATIFGSSPSTLYIQDKLIIIGSWLCLPFCILHVPLGGGAEQLARQDLRPAAGGSTKVDRTDDTFEDIKVVVYLQEFEGRTRSPALLLGLPVVDVLRTTTQ